MRPKATKGGKIKRGVDFFFFCFSRGQELSNWITGLELLGQLELHNTGPDVEMFAKGGQAADALQIDLILPRKQICSSKKFQFDLWMSVLTCRQLIGHAFFACSVAGMVIDDVYCTPYKGAWKTSDDSFLILRNVNFQELPPSHLRPQLLVPSCPV